MAQKYIRCKLVTPAAALVDAQVAYASVPCWDGLMGFLPGRAPLLARLGLGELRLDMAQKPEGEGGSRAFLVEGGFVKMADNQLTILAERATPSEALTLADAEAEMKAAMAEPAVGSVSAGEMEKRSQARERARIKMQLVRERGN